MTETAKAEKNGHVYRWITDRQPTEADANGAGAVRIRKYPNGSSSAAVHWQYIGPGVPWQHCHDWTGPRSSDSEEFTDEDGNLWRWSPLEQSWSLASVVDVPPVENSEPVLAASYDALLIATSGPFLSISRSFGPHGEHYLDVVATDGTAWYKKMNPGGHDWRQHDSLPEVA